MLCTAMDSQFGPDDASRLIEQLGTMLDMHQQALQDQLNIWTRRQESFMARHMRSPLQQTAEDEFALPGVQWVVLAQARQEAVAQARQEVSPATLARERQSTVCRETKTLGRGKNEFGENEKSPGICDERVRSATNESKAFAMINSERFEVFCAGIIVLNAVLIGVETQYKAYHLEGLGGITVAQHAINAWFAVEMLLRMYASGCKQWLTSKKDKFWNMFDMFLVCVWPGDLYFSSLDSQSGYKTRSFRAFRLFRLIRTIRIFRVMRTVLVLRRMIYALTHSLSTLCWSLVLLFFEMYFFVVCFTQAATDFRIDHGQEHAEAEPLNKSFGSLEDAFYSMYMAVSGGVDWGDLAEPLFQISPGWFHGGLFILFTFVTIFGVLNVLAAVFVESAMLSASYHSDLLLAQKQDQKRLHMDQFREIFVLMDPEASGCITVDDIEELFSEPRTRDLLEALEVSTSDAHQLVSLLDADGSGSIGINEFCDGCLQLKGEARSFDVSCLIHAVHRLL
eukprot:CAMPEP_0117476920 /NCGR_PEP_ID=MMETSP0784-20121206/10556_1 /TAXON_ID=39447 /ORGANISM="" /LENGTH=507 /DNA_ID=CAMNT_0005271207 /DNA_START=1 /DNA_END=1521 /DNA_ORIENTATION=+